MSRQMSNNRSTRVVRSGGLSKVIELYNADPSEKELELGMSIQYPSLKSTLALNTRTSIWDKLMSGLLKQSSSVFVQQHLDVHYAGNVRRRMMFVDGVNQRKDVWIHKVGIQRADVDFAIPEIYKSKLKLASEKPTSPTSGSPLFMRAKLRVAITIDKTVVEVDLVKQLDKNEPMLKAVLSDLFGKSQQVVNAESATTFVPNHSLWDELRVEIELPAPSSKDAVFACKRVMESCFGTAPNSELQSWVFRVAQLMLPKGRFLDSFRQQNGLKKLLNSVVDLNTTTYWTSVRPLLPHYFITDKVDGVRGVCIIDSTGVVVVTDKVMTWKIEEGVYSGGQGVFDCEYLDGGRLFLFDTIAINGSGVVRQSFDERLRLLREFDIANITSSIQDLKCVVKEYIQVSDPKEIETFYKKQREYAIDGLIFVPSQSSKLATEYSSMVCYKWKPVELKTIDFYLKRVPENILGHIPFKDIVDQKQTKKPRVVYAMFVGISAHDQEQLGMELMPNYQVITGRQPARYGGPPTATQTSKQLFPIQFSTADKPVNYVYQPPSNLTGGDKLDGKIVEMGWSSKDNTWVFHRVRTDREVELARGNYFGNYYRIAELTWQSIINPLTMESIASESQGYFKEADSGVYRDQRWFNSFVKSQLLERLFDSRLIKGLQKGNTMAIDLAAGKGQDLARLANIGVSSGLFIDADADAIAELTSRRHNSRKMHNAMKVMTHLADLKKPAKELIADMKHHNIAKGSVDLVVCNFAIHYLVHDDKSMRNLWELVSYYAATGCHFVITCFDGTKVMNLLSANGSPTEWSMRENGVVKYKITPKFSDVNVPLLGNQIGVLLPFSLGEMVDEYLIDIDKLGNFWSDNGWSVEARGSFGDFIDMYSKKLSDADTQYVSLYGYTVLQKNADNHVVWKSNLQSLLPKRAKTGAGEGQHMSPLNILDNVQRTNCILWVLPDGDDNGAEYAHECMQSVGLRDCAVNSRLRKAIYKVIHNADLQKELKRYANGTCSVIDGDVDMYPHAKQYAQTLCRLPVMPVCIHNGSSELWCMDASEVARFGIETTKEKAKWSGMIGN